ncbi:MAG: AMP-binding protein [Puniceicoccales bacterium]|jgi:O-succinylbenzoic acid--CoA ligase|nr:AMP-binding protein [Puniceicoccales bacterium]
MFAADNIRQFLRKQLFPSQAGERAQAAFEAYSANATGGPLLVKTDDVAKYIGTWLAGMATGRSVFCANPRWSPHEWREAHAAIFTPGNSPTARPLLHIPTGGTGGRIRFISHTHTTLAAAARAQVTALAGRRQLNAVSPLPPWHISGLMPIVRALTCGGTLLLCDGSFHAHAPASAPLPHLPNASAKNALQISLVPTQLFRLLALPGGTRWLRRFDCVLLGGAPPTASLLATAHLEKLRIAIGYGMTETAAFIALHSPEEFTGEWPVTGHILSHAQIQILDTAGDTQPLGTPGLIDIKATSLTPEANGHLTTQDEGILENHRLRVLGRVDRFIISGGEKTDPRRVEAALLAVPWVRAAHVSGIPDNEWGQRVAALVELSDAAAGDWQEKLADITRATLPKHSVPSRWARIPALPFDERGKISPTTLARLLA